MAVVSPNRSVRQDKYILKVRRYFAVVLKSYLHIGYYLNMKLKRGGNYRN